MDFSSFSPLSEHPLISIVNSLDSNDYGGIYMHDNGKIILNTLSNVVIENKINKVTASNLGLVYTSVKYSKKQLLLARDKILSANLSTIDAVGITAQHNGVAIFCKNISQKDRKEIIDLSPVKNVIFYDEDSFIKYREQDKKCSKMNPFPEWKEPELQIKNVENKRVLVGSAGNYIEYAPGKNWTTSAYFVSWNYGTPAATIGFLTCGHGYKFGDSVYVGGEFLGRMDIWNMPVSDVDAGYAEFVDIEKVEWYGIKGIGHLQGSGPALENADIYMSGARTWKDVGALAQGKVNATNVTYRSTNEDPDGTQTEVIHQNYFTYSFHPLHGDSGAPLVQVLPFMGEQTLVCIVGLNISEYNDKGYPWGGGCEILRVVNKANLTFLE